MSVMVTDLVSYKNRMLLAIISNMPFLLVAVSFYKHIIMTNTCSSKHTDTGTIDTLAPSLNKSFIMVETTIYNSSFWQLIFAN